MGSSALRCAAAIFLISLAACGTTTQEERPGRFTLGRGEDSVVVSYAPGPPENVYDSLLVEIELSSNKDPGTDRLFLELLPAQGGWSRVVDSFLVRDTDATYRARVWLGPTFPGQYVLCWQTDPFTGHTYYLSAWYDSTGRLTQWDHEPDEVASGRLPLVRDTMELTYQFWPEVLYRRVHLQRRTDTQRVFWVITESLYRSAGLSSRVVGGTYNLRFDPAYPNRTRRWSGPGWVVDTLSVWVRDTLVAQLMWTYEEFAENWQQGELLFREWQHDLRPRFYFQVDGNGHLMGVWPAKPQGKYIAARAPTDTSKPAWETLKRAFVKGDTSPVP